MYMIDIISDRQICNLHGQVVNLSEQIDMCMIDRYVTDIDRNIVEKEKEG